MSLYILRNCLYIVSIWHAILPHDLSKNFFCLENWEWLINNLSKHNEWGIWFSVTIHSLWCLRNKFVFEEKTTRIVEVVGSIKALVHKMLNIVKQGTGTRKVRMSGDTLIKWNPPEKKVIKVNVDGSVFKRINNAACGVSYETISKDLSKSSPV
ncbi:hypothetical protein AHAS_Ahas04G0092700 [Arachis hypogaea]